jgi:hypothetical protein
MFSTDTRGNNEHEKKKDPGNILIPPEKKIRKTLRSFPKGSPVKNPEPTEGHLSIEAIRNR